MLQNDFEITTESMPKSNAHFFEFLGYLLPIDKLRFADSQLIGLIEKPRREVVVIGRLFL